MQLVIVESPTKAKTIGKFLGKDYIVRSSFGHVRDLPKSKMGVDIEKNFEPQYSIPTKAKPVLRELKEELEKVDGVILATDEDREGEAIAWHLVEALGLKGSKKAKKKDVAKDLTRIVFHEITKSAIEKALENPREIDFNQVNAQQARRVLDRLVGYELSPFLWHKIRYGLSAGRVQSVTVRFVVDREREIDAFKREEYWTIEADFLKTGDKHVFHAVANKSGTVAQLKEGTGKKFDKFEIKSDEEAKKLVESLNNATYSVLDITQKEVKRTPAPPFVTSTLQQEASRKLHMSAKQTMMFAQKLYETGKITYMRTDSVFLAQSALHKAREVITERYGKEFALSEPRYYKTKSKGAQEAHEAIRPTDLSRTPEMMEKLEPRQRKLYELIWKRTLASQMQQAVFDATSVDILADTTRIDGFIFRASGQVVKFEGYIKVYTEGRDDESDEVEGQLPDLEKEDNLDLEKLEPLQHFTEPPPRYTDATLIKILEANGIGRPSTYAPTLSTIQDRDYVEKIEKRYHPTEVGILVNDLLVEHFPGIVDVGFTSHIEEELDDVEEGKLSWTAVVKEFYMPFKRNLDIKNETVKKVEEISDTPCEHCGKMMIIKFGRNGKFRACPDPESKITRPMPEEEDKIKTLTEKTRGEMCPICGRQMEVHRGRFGYFLGCADYPRCKGIAKIFNKTGFKCPNCQVGDVVEKKSRGRGKTFYACSKFPDCNYLMSKKPESDEDIAEGFKYWKENPPKKKPERKKKTDGPVSLKDALANRTFN